MSLFGFAQLWFHNIICSPLLFLELSVVIFDEQLLDRRFITKHFICSCAHGPVQSIRICCFLFDKNLIGGVHFKLVFVIKINDGSDRSPHPTLNWVKIHRRIIEWELISDGLSFSGSLQIIVLFRHYAGLVSERHPFGRVKKTCHIVRFCRICYQLIDSVTTDSSQTFLNFIVLLTREQGRRIRLHFIAVDALFRYGVV